MKNEKQAICTGCTLLCDDVTFEIGESSIASKVDCSVAQSWIKNANQFLTAAAENTPKQNEIIGKSIAQKLSSANAPLIVGLNHLTTEAQQMAWRIADIVGATIDVTLSKNNRASIYSLQQQGKVTASLGEIANRSDLVVFWFCDPVTTHPRLIERLTKTRSATKKRIVVVGDANAATAAVADEVFSVDHEAAADFIYAVRVALKSRASKTNSQDSPSDAVNRLSSLLVDCSYGSWIYGHPHPIAAFDDVTIASQALVRELNDHTRFVSLGLRSDQNAASAENVLASFSGFPAAVSLAMGYPQYNGSEFAAETLLERGETDFVLLFAGLGTSAEINALSPAARAFLSKAPKVIVSSERSLNLAADSLASIDRPGVNDHGEFCRVDGVSLRVESIAAGGWNRALDFLYAVHAELVHQLPGLCSDRQ